MKSLLHTGLALSIALLAACSDGAKSGTSEQIDSAGGTVSGGEASVTVPKGALDVSTRIVVAKSAVSVGAPDGYALVGPAIAFTPHGTVFAKAVTLSLPYDSSVEQLAVLRLDDETDKSWEPVDGGTFTNGKALLDVDSFSIYAVAAAVAAAGGTSGVGGGTGTPLGGVSGSGDGVGGSSGSSGDAGGSAGSSSIGAGGSSVGAGGGTAASDGEYVSCDRTDPVTGMQTCGDSFYPTNIVKLLGANFPPPCQGTVVPTCNTDGAVLGCHYTNVDGIPGVTLTNWFYFSTAADIKNGVLCKEANATYVDPP